LFLWWLLCTNSVGAYKFYTNQENALKITRKAFTAEEKPRFPRKGEDGMAKIVLTSDRTLMSNYHNNEFLGFGTCAPPNFVPDWLYSYLFSQTSKQKKASQTQRHTV